jgi:hypothetical protein
VIEWLKGDSFDGLLVFDECHKVRARERCYLRAF